MPTKDGIGFIDPAHVKISEWPSNVIPKGAIAFDQADPEGEGTAYGFYDPASGEFHFQDWRPSVPTPHKG